MAKIKNTPAAELNRLMGKYNLNPFSLSNMLNASYTFINKLVHDKAGITISMAYKLAKFFGKPPGFWIDLQISADIEKALNDKIFRDVLSSIPNVNNISHVPQKKPKAKAVNAAKKRG
ncbi:MAG: hypothetical protein LBH43_20605 [Treponema sp.]|jgi:addiction module HigA family antidote|nr:hypothetical protein [Treponema sp.]